MQKFLKVIKITALVLLSVLIAACIAFALILEPKIKIDNWQELDDARLAKIERTLTLLDQNDEVINDKIYDNNKIFVPLEKVNQTTIDAFVSIEDKRFYKHKGIDYARILSAVKANLFSKSFKEGASTISQQLIKNTHLNNEKTITRKVKEMRIARDLERHYTKNEILEMYLNIIYFGNNMYGIGTAANVMFHKQIDELNLEESALLAGIINNPSRYNPYKHMDNATSRRNIVLRQMFKNKKISLDEYNKAVSTPIEVDSTKSQNHYINGIINEAATILGCDEDDLFLRNYTIGSFYNSNTQLINDTSITNMNFDDKNINIHAVIVDNSTHTVISDSGKSSFNLSSLKRQMGSTIKPILSYAPALENKSIYPTTPIYDQKMSFDGYSPNNYKGKYHGWTTVADSLMLSLNVPSVKLLEMNGIEYSKSIAQKFGLRFNKDDNSLSLALGSSKDGFTLKNIANAYSVFANSGKYSPIKYVKYIKDNKGNTVYRHKNSELSAIREDTAYMINEILSDCAQKGTAKKLRGLNAAAKTGTVGTKSGNSDAYCIAYTKKYTVAVWIGSTKSYMPNSISGGVQPTEIAKSILTQLDIQKEGFVPPSSIVKMDIDLTELNDNHRVLLADDNTPQIFRKRATFSIHNPVKMPRKSIIKLDDIEFMQPHNFEILDNPSNEFHIIDSL